MSSLKTKMNRNDSKQKTRLISNKKVTKKIDFKKQRIEAEKKRGLIYIGHLPHGFYENEMKEYFKQFGKVTNVKVCRSRKTGKSKGYGYVEFHHPEVAKIAAETMNNYLMFKKRLVATFVPYEKRPKHIFHGTYSMPGKTSLQNRRIKMVKAQQEMSDEKLEKLNNARKKRLQKRLERINSLGFNFKIEPVDDLTQ